MALAAVALLAATQCAAAQTAVTLGNFVDRFTVSGALRQIGATMDPLECGPNPIASGQVCKSLVHVPGIGISVLLKSPAGSEAVVSATLMMGNPAAVSEDDRAVQAATGLLLICTARLIATLSPELSSDERGRLVTRVFTGADQGAKEVRNGNWLYVAESGLMVTFAAERKP